MARTSSVAAALAICCAMPALAQGDAITLVRARDGSAVIRIAEGPLKSVKPGDTVGSSGAIVGEAAAGRIVLHESFTGADGKPNRALIVIREGERGGTRYLWRPDAPSPPVTKIVPAKPPQP